MTDFDELLKLYDRELRQEIEYPGARKEVLPHLVRFVRPAPGANIITYSRLDEDDCQAQIAEQVAYFAPLNQPFAWKVYAHDTPPDLQRCLQAQGFILDDIAALMVLDLGRTPPALLAPPAADLRRITRPEGLADVIQVMQEVWGGDFAWIYPRMGPELELPGYLSVYTAYQDGSPACAGWTYFPPDSQFASLWGGSTLPEFRRRGLYTSLLAVRAQEAMQRGRRYLIVEAGDLSRPIVARHGFQVLSTIFDYEWKGD